MNTFQINDIVKHFVGQSNTMTVPAIFKKWLGSYNNAILFSQIIYWSSRTTDENGWFYKSYKEWETEIYLTKREAEYAVDQLENLGLIKTKIAKINGTPTKHFLLLEGEFHRLFTEFLKTEQSLQVVENKVCNGKQQNVVLENDETSLSYSSQNSPTYIEKEDIRAREESTEGAKASLRDTKPTAAPTAELSPKILNFPSLVGQKLSTEKLNEIVDLFCYIAQQQGRKTLQNDYDWFAMVKQLELEGMSIFGIKSLYRYCKEIEKMNAITPKVMNWKFSAYKDFLEKQKSRQTKPKTETKPFDPMKIVIETSQIPAGY